MIYSKKICQNIIAALSRHMACVHITLQWTNHQHSCTCHMDYKCVTNYEPQTSRKKKKKNNRKRLSTVSQYSLAANNQQQLKMNIKFHKKERKTKLGHKKERPDCYKCKVAWHTIALGVFRDSGSFNSSNFLPTSANTGTIRGWLTEEMVLTLITLQPHDSS